MNRVSQWNPHNSFLKIYHVFHGKIKPNFESDGYNYYKPHTKLNRNPFLKFETGPKNRQTGGAPSLVLRCTNVMVGGHKK